MAEMSKEELWEHWFVDHSILLPRDLRPKETTMLEIIKRNFMTDLQSVIEGEIEKRVGHLCTCDGRVGNNDIYCPFHCAPHYADIKGD